LTSIESGVVDLRSMAEAAKANDPQKAQELAKSGQQITAAETALRTAVDG
jgi:hypothetical protein